MAQMAQANWVSASMPMEYTRQTKSIAVNMIHSLVKKIKKGWRPGCSPASSAQSAEDDQSSDEGENDLEFFVRKSGHLALEKLKFHVQSLDEPAFVACKARGLLISACDPVGSSVPDPKMICETCMKKRRDLFAEFV